MTWKKGQSDNLKDITEVFGVDLPHGSDVGAVVKGFVRDGKIEITEFELNSPKVKGEQ